MTSATAATTAATTPHDFIQGWYAALFQSLCNEPINGVGNRLKGILGRHETLNALVLIGLVLEILETREIRGLKLNTTAMTLLQAAPKVHDLTVQGDGLIVSQKGFSRSTSGLDFRIGGNDGAK